MPRLRGVVLYLHTQSSYIDIDDLFLAEIIRAPHLFENVGAVKRGIRIIEEILYHLEFDLRKLYISSVF